MTLGRLSLGDWARTLAKALGWALDDLDEFEEEQDGLPRGHHRIVGSVGGRETLVVETIAGRTATRRRPLEVEIEGSRRCG